MHFRVNLASEEGGMETSEEAPDQDLCVRNNYELCIVHYALENGFLTVAEA